jgi:hypothetical protein
LKNSKVILDILYVFPKFLHFISRLGEHAFCGSVTLSFLRHFRTDFFGPSTGGGSSGILDRNNKILVDLIADERRSREKLETSIWDNCKLPPINYSIQTIFPLLRKNRYIY